jgi:hypothetical protein
VNRHSDRPAHRLLVIVVALVGIGLLAALVLPRILRDGHGTTTTKSSYTFNASTGDQYGMLHWTVEEGQIKGCYTEVTTSDYSGGRAASAQKFDGRQNGDEVRLEGLLQNGGSIKGALRGDRLSLSDTFGPVDTYRWRGTTEQQFWNEAPGGDSGTEPTC